jgi:hypothetical protein
MLFWSLKHWNLGFVSDFLFRISGLSGLGLHQMILANARRLADNAPLSIF